MTYPFRKGHGIVFSQDGECWRQFDAGIVVHADDEQERYTVRVVKTNALVLVDWDEIQHDDPTP